MAHSLHVGTLGSIESPVLRAARMPGQSIAPASRTRIPVVRDNPGPGRRSTPECANKRAELSRIGIALPTCGDGLRREGQMSQESRSHRKEKHDRDPG